MMLIYNFNNKDDKPFVLSGGPYLVYGRSLVLKSMPGYFDFAPNEMTRVLVWIKFPNLPFKCWSLKCLSNIASVLGKPLQCDKLTSTMSRLSYARVLVELDLLGNLTYSINIILPNGAPLVQSVVYETLFKFCKHIIIIINIIITVSSIIINIIVIFLVIIVITIILTIISIITITTIIIVVVVITKTINLIRKIK